MGLRRSRNFSHTGGILVLEEVARMWKGRAGEEGEAEGEGDSSSLWQSLPRSFLQMGLEEEAGILEREGTDWCLCRWSETVEARR